MLGVRVSLASRAHVAVHTVIKAIGPARLGLRPDRGAALSGVVIGTAMWLAGAEFHLLPSTVSSTAGLVGAATIGGVMSQTVFRRTLRGIAGLTVGFVLLVGGTPLAPCLASRWIRDDGSVADL